MKLSIIVPCYNEENNINNLVSAFHHFDNIYNDELELVLVNNGSTDLTGDRIAKLQDSFIKSVHVPVNQGYGYGLMQGLKAATGEWIGWLHADLQVPPQEIIKFWELIKSDPDPRRFYKGIRNSRSLLDRVFTFCMSIFETLLFRTRLYDIGAIPVVFHRSFLNSLKSPTDDFSFELYVYYKAKATGMVVVRRHVKMQSRKEGKSSWNHGIGSKLLQSKRIILASLEIRKEKKNL